MDRKPWQKQPGESDKDYHYFCAYLDLLSGRSLAKLAKAIGRSTVRMEQVSKKNNWQDRIKAWDAHLSRMMQDTQATEVVEMHKRHIQLSLGMQTAAVKELLALVHKIEAAAATARAAALQRGENPDTAFHEPILSATEITRLSQNGIELERLIRGLSTANVRTLDEEQGLERLSVEELKILRGLRAKMGA